MEQLPQEKEKMLTSKQEIYKGAGSIGVLVISPSGQGKSTSIRNLDPDHTFVVNVMGKALPFLGAAQKYKTGLNMITESRAPQIIEKLEQISKNKPEIDTIVIDDAQYIMATEFMSKVLVKGYDKFSIMAQNMWNLLINASKLRDGLKVFILTHEETITSGTSVIERKMKTLGKLLDEKLTPEGLMTIVLFANVQVDTTGRRYFFQTQTDGASCAKSPMGMFPDIIPNDLDLVSKRIDEYYGGVSLEKSALRFDNPLK